MPLITFLSDFGTLEHYVAVTKAAIFKELPNQKILDISHEVKMGNIVQAAYLLKSVFEICPKGTIHIVAVGTTQVTNHLLIKYNNQYFIGPDNGIFPLCFEDDMTNIEVSEIPVQKNASFPTKELYVAVVVKLVKNEFSEFIGKKDINKKIGRQPIVHQGTMTGHVIYVEKNGNLITNIKKSFFEQFTIEKKFVIAFEYERLTRIYNTYQDVDYGDCVVFFNSNNLMEIAINHGNAAELLGMKYDSMIKISYND